MSKEIWKQKHPSLKKRKKKKKKRKEKKGKKTKERSINSR